MNHTNHVINPFYAARHHHRQQAQPTVQRTQFAKPTPDWSVAINSMVQGGLIAAMLLCAMIIIAAGAARVIGADGTVTGLDLNAGMLNIAHPSPPHHYA